MAKDGNEKYIDALSQAEAGKAVRDHLKHSEFGDQLMDVLRKRSDFSFIVMKSQFLNLLFWAVIIPINLLITVLVVKFPQVGEWLLSFCKTSP